MRRAGGVTTIHCGAFDAETLWRDETLAKLPALPDPQAKAIVGAMDELLFLFCKSSDVLLTRNPVAPAQLRYLSDIGLTFRTSDEPLEDSGGAQDANPFQQMLNKGAVRKYKELLPPGGFIEPFAVLDGLQELSSLYRLDGRYPAMETIRHVNSKLYSAELRESLGYGPPTRIVRSHTELRHAAEAMLLAGPVLAKDTFGVSGKGNLLIQSTATLERIAGYVAVQEQKGKSTLFLLEPLLDKEADFSCQFHIDADGGYELISVQQVLNAEFAYQGTFSASVELIEKLEREGYFKLMQKTAELLYESGYNGHVCVDSMLLEEGGLVPIVEINARKSMSLIKKRLDDYLAEFSLQGNLTYLSVICLGIVEYADLLAAMDREGLLFRPERGEGILPLSAGTFTINQAPGLKRKGRLYLSAVAGRIECCSELLARMRALLKSRGIAVTN
ncbi:hypothetical protein [Paenibacillus sp. Leaf72]|uniref:hypothetical protein n=1 Tax=Paenibacillus sp. Leaf72 TaxID=1736234 RepID=UPI0007003A88|nr:hypothetical protein [Paenibacillus sp. Leaf72]KQO12731.1 hypothetical protein ASF12_30555 [Paenibacillus sp. Leaf72]